MVTVRYGHLLTVVLLWFGITTPLIMYSKWHQRAEFAEMNADLDRIAKRVRKFAKEQAAKEKEHTAWEMEHMPEKYAVIPLP